MYVIQYGEMIRIDSMRINVDFYKQGNKLGFESAFVVNNYESHLRSSILDPSESELIIEDENELDVLISSLTRDMNEPEIKSLIMYKICGDLMSLNIHHFFHPEEIVKVVNTRVREYVLIEYKNLKENK